MIKKLDGGVVSPAYGRDYRTYQEAKDDLLKGLDFVLNSIHPTGGRYCSIRDFESGSIVEVRFNRKQELVLVKIP